MPRPRRCPRSATNGIRSRMSDNGSLSLHLKAHSVSSRKSPTRAAGNRWLAFPSRRPFQVTLAAALTAPEQLWAEVCDKERPLWDSATGPATVFDEALHLGASPLSLVLLAATALAVRFRSSWGGLAVVCGWSGLVALVTFVNSDDPSGVRQLAIEEGCIGSPALFIAAVAAISVATIIYTSPRPARSD